MSQSLPATDSFAETVFDATAFTEQVCMYWPTKLWNQAAESDTGYSLTPAAGKLCELEGRPEQAAALTDPADPTNYVDGFVYREAQADDCEVFGVFSLATLVGNKGPLSFKVCGVGARMVDAAGMEITDGSTYASITAPTGYLFLLANQDDGGGDSDANWLLLHITTTTPAADATIRVLSKTAADLSTFHVERPFEMRLEVSGTGATVTLTAKHAGVTVLTAADTDASRTTAAGHACLVLANEHLESATLEHVHLCWHFGMSGASGVIFRDEWQRSSKAALLPVTSQYAAGETGTLLSSAYTGDRDGATDFQYRVLRDSVSANERLAVDLTPLGGFIIDRKPVENVHNQARDLTVVFESGGNANLEAGVVVRGYFGNGAVLSAKNATDKQCYMALVRVQAGAWTVEIVRIAGGNYTLLATGTLWVESFDTEHVLGLRATNVTHRSGSVQLEPLWNNQGMSPWTLKARGVRTRGKYLYDDSSSRLQAGTQQGFYLFSDHATEQVFATELTQPVGYIYS